MLRILSTITASGIPFQRKKSKTPLLIVTKVIAIASFHRIIATIDGTKDCWKAHRNFFEYLDRSEYRVWGEGYLFNGVVLAHPKNGDEHEVGYCVDGQRYIGKLPVYPDDLPDDSPEYREGKRKSVKVNIYERNLAARQACIDQYGAICYICGFDFGETYGEEFEGMIHVHHIKMISEFDHEYIIDPINDLRPVCPNCHMVLHSKKSGFTIDEVKAMLE